MKDVSSTSFGYVVAFLLPGIVTIYGLGFISSNIATLLQPAMVPGAALGPSLLFLLAALVVGMVVAGLCFVLFEKLICRNHKFEPTFFQKLARSGKLELFRAIVDEHYRYHQFYGGFTIGAAVWFGGWLVTNFHSIGPRALTLSMVGFTALELVTGYYARHLYVRYLERANGIVADEKLLPGEGKLWVGVVDGQGEVKEVAEAAGHQEKPAVEG